MQPKYYGAAAQYNRPGGSFGKILKIVGLVVGVIILITAIYFIVMAITSGPRNEAARLVARERQVLTFMNNNQAKIDNDSFRTITSNAISLVTSDTYALQQGLRSSFGLSGPPEEITKSEADTTSTKTLDNARIQSRFDTTYRDLLRDKIAATLQLANQVIQNSSGSFKTAVQTTIKNLQEIDKKLEAFKF